ncbi:MAG: acyltransferase [Acidobacteriota bacterium]
MPLRPQRGLAALLLEGFFWKAPRWAANRVRLGVYRILGMKLGQRNRMEGGARCRHVRQIEIGDDNYFTQGCWLVPSDAGHGGLRIRLGNNNYFNRNLMIDACGRIDVGNDNMVGPGVYITDSNHAFGPGISPKDAPMTVGHVRIGNRCWIGANAVILSGVELGDECVIGAGAVVTRSVAAGTVVAGVPARPIQ